MSSLATLLALAASSLGWGAIALRLAGMLDTLPWRERIAWSFGLGIGVIGWFGFFAALAGHPGPVAFIAITVAGLPGLIWLGHGRSTPAEPFTPWTWALLVMGAALLLGDMAEALAPPTDADSLAYHFTIPRRILAEGRLVFVPRAADGAIPLLQQMTYLAALALGGERGMTLWCGLSGWAAVLLAYAVGRRHLPRDWALAGALAVATLPAMLYGAGSGQVEARLATFVTIAVVAIMESHRHNRLGAATIAGLAVGFSMASKYPGLLVAFLCGLAMLAQRRGFAKAAVLTAVACVAGLQWYGWNWWNIGDPVFPMLYGILPYAADAPWNAVQNAAFKEWAAEVESPMPRGLSDILLYPLRVTFAPPASLDAGRTGLGVLPALLLPFAVIGAWRNRRHPAAAGWLTAAAIIVGFYLLWSAFGASQRVRHYLPFMPLIIVGLLSASLRVTPVRPLAAGVAVVLLAQTAAQAVFVRNPVAHLLSGESRTAYLERNVGLAFAVTWANANLPDSAKVLVNARQWLYLLNPQALFVTKVQQAEIEVRPDNTDARIFWRQMRHRGITHAILPHADLSLHSPDQDALYLLMAGVVATGCGRIIETLSGPDAVMSRTMGNRGVRIIMVPVVELTPAGCRWETDPP